MLVKKVNLHKPQLIVALPYSDGCRGLLALWRRRGRCQPAFIHCHSGARYEYIWIRRRRFLKSYGDGAWSTDQDTCCLRGGDLIQHFSRTASLYFTLLMFSSVAWHRRGVSYYWQHMYHITIIQTAATATSAGPTGVAFLAVSITYLVSEVMESFSKSFTMPATWLIRELTNWRIYQCASSQREIHVKFYINVKRIGHQLR